MNMKKNVKHISSFIYHVIIFAKYFIYDCKKNDKPVDFYNFQVKFTTRIVIEEYRYELYNLKLEFLVKWSVLSDSL